MQRREMYVQIKASGGGDGQGPHGQQGLMAAAGGRAHSETTHLARSVGGAGQQAGRVYLVTAPLG
jgi:hypothetical protein